MARVVQSVGPALVLCAGWRASADMVRQPGAVRRTGARVPHSGRRTATRIPPLAQLCEGPHFLHIYSRSASTTCLRRNASCGGLVRRDCRNYTS